MYLLKSNRFLLACLYSLGALTSLMLLLILVFLLKESLPVFTAFDVLGFVKDSSWHPTEGKFYILPMVFASLALMFFSVLLAAPIGIFVSIYIFYYAPKSMKQVLRRLIEALSGIPSVVYGFWGLVVLVPIIQSFEPPGVSMLAGILVLSLMILPTISLFAISSFSNVPKEYLQSASGLGLSKYRFLKDIVLPYAKPNLLAGVLLASGRAVGETMAVLMVCGNIVQVPTSVFDPVRSLTANIALEMAYATGSHRSSLFFSGLILSIFIILFIYIVHLLSKENPNACC